MLSNILRHSSRIIPAITIGIIPAVAARTTRGGRLPKGCTIPVLRAGGFPMAAATVYGQRPSAAAVTLAAIRMMIRTKA